MRYCRTCGQASAPRAARLAEIGTARHFGSTSGEIGSGTYPAQAERLRTFTGCRAQTFALDTSGKVQGEDEPDGGEIGTAARSGAAHIRYKPRGCSPSRVAGRGRSRLMKPDAPRDARHGAQGRGARSGRATSRTDGANATGGNTARIGANVDGEGRTVAVLPDVRTGEAHHGRHVWPEIGSTSGEIGSGAHPAQAERLRTFTGCRARTFALDEAGRPRDTPRNARTSARFLE